jgi:hypothetical protein
MTTTEMTVAAKNARVALWHAAARLQTLRSSARAPERATIDGEIDSVQSDLRVLDAVLVLLAAVEAPPLTLSASAGAEIRSLSGRLDREIQRDSLRLADLDALRATIARARTIARTLGPLFA